VRCPRCELPSRKAGWGLPKTRPLRIKPWQSRLAWISTGARRCSGVRDRRRETWAGNNEEQRTECVTSHVGSLEGSGLEDLKSVRIDKHENRTHARIVFPVGAEERNRDIIEMNQPEQPFAYAGSLDCSVD
jgi:hypothetical protein